jgi:hypothetical protein
VLLVREAGRFGGFRSSSSAGWMRWRASESTIFDPIVSGFVWINNH